MKTLKRILLVVLLLVGVALLIPVFVNGDISGEKEVTISQPKSMVFEYLKLTKNQEQFAVWTEEDPATKKSYTGVDGTLGSVYKWESDVVGIGEQEIKNIAEGSKIEYELRFRKPFKATHTAWFATEDAGANATKVKWGFKGEMGYPIKGMLLFMDMKSDLGDKLQRGLENLKVILEKMPPPEPPFVPGDSLPTDPVSH